MRTLTIGKKTCGKKTLYIVRLKPNNNQSIVPLRCFDKKDDAISYREKVKKSIKDYWPKIISKEMLKKIRLKDPPILVYPKK